MLQVLIILEVLNGVIGSHTDSFRPVVILESDVKINTEMEGKDGSTPENAWVIN